MYRSPQQMISDQRLRERIVEVLLEMHEANLPENRILSHKAPKVPKDREVREAREVEGAVSGGAKKKSKNLTEWQKCVRYYGNIMDAKANYDKKTKTWKKKSK